MRARFLNKLVLVLMCACAFFHSMQAFGNNCCSSCCEEDKFGFWPSRGPGGRAFIIGATITAAGIAAILVACNNRSRHSSSSCKSRAANNDNGNDEFNPNLNPNGGGTPAALVNNFANQAMNNADAIAGVGIPLEIETSTINPINTITTQGGATQSLRNKKSRLKDKYKGEKISSVGSEELVNVNFKVKLTGSHAGSLNLIPFIIYPDGRTYEGIPFTIKANDHSGNTPPITFTPSKGGGYKAGLRVSSTNVSIPVTIHLECAITNSGNQSVQVVGTSGSPLEKQIVCEFTL